MKISYLALSLFALLSLSACSSQDADQPRTEQTTTQTATLSLGAQINRFGADATDEQTFRAIETQDFQFEITDGQNKFIIDDNGKNTKEPSKRAHLDRTDLQNKAAQLKFYVQVRSKATKTIVGSLYSTWEYKSRNTNDWRLNGKDITLTGINPATDALEVRVVVGGNLDAANNRIEVPTTISQEVKLSTAGLKVSMPVPFASDWVALSYDSSKQLYTTAGDALLRLKPLGTLVISTVRSSMKQPMQVSGLRYVTNALAFVGHYKLDGADKLSFVGEGSKFTMPVTGDAYFTQTFTFSQPLQLTSRPHDTAIVFWASATGKEKAVAWDTRRNQRGDLATMLLQPQTHVYAEGAVNATSKQSVAKPNYRVVPIMGTNSNFESGKSVAINAELYDQPNQLLGYVAKYSVNTEGTGFDTSHRPEDVSLVNWKVAKEFINGKKLIGADGQEATFKMGNEALAAYMGNDFSYVWGENTTTEYLRPFDQNNHSKGGVVARTQSILVQFGSDDKANVAEATRSIMRVYMKDQNPNVSYAIYGRELNETELKNRGRMRSQDQSLMRIEGAFPDGPGTFPVGTTRLTSIYLGKYFVGTAYSPLLGQRPAFEEAIWQEANFTQGKVERIFPAGGRYEASSWNPNDADKVADVDNLRPDNTTRYDVGRIPINWYINKGGGYRGPSKLMQQLQLGAHPTRNGAQWLQDPAVFDPAQDKVTNTLFFPAGAGGALSSVVRDAKYMWMALWTIADKYQGDTAD